MYEVVGCPDCRAIWIRSGEADTAQCTRCRKTHDLSRLRTLASAKSVEAARDARSQLLTERSDQGQDNVADFSTLTDAVGEAGVTDDEYLVAHDIDPETVEQSDDRTPERSVRETVLHVIDDEEAPTRERIVARTGEHGMTRTETIATIDRLVDAGEVLRTDGELRRL